MGEELGYLGDWGLWERGWGILERGWGVGVPERGLISVIIISTDTIRRFSLLKLNIKITDVQKR